jgi:hypothetical protein
MNTQLKEMLAREFYTASSVAIINKAHSSRAILDKDNEETQSHNLRDDLYNTFLLQPPPPVAWKAHELCEVYGET